MIYSIPVDKTNTIYQRYIFKNSGGDSQLQIKSNYQGGAQDGISRALIGAPQNESFSYDTRSLRLYSSYANLYTDKFTISVYPVTNYWDAGFSLFGMDLSGRTIGSTWKYRTSQTQWGNLGSDYNMSQSISNQIKYKYLYDSLNFIIPSNWNIDNGLLLKLNNQQTTVGSILYYSANTNTPLYPRYVYYIDDYQYITGSNSNLITNIKDYIISVDNIKPNYDYRQTIKFNVAFAPKRYLKTWSSSVGNYQDQVNILDPSINATYAIYDVTQINHFYLIQHSQYTRINSNGTENYFNLKLDQFLTNRTYKIQLKINNVIIPIKEYFKIV